MTIINGNKRKGKMSAVKIDKIIRSRRRSLGLEVTRDANLIIRAPHRISLGDIEKLVLTKLVWIEKKQKIAREKHLTSAPKRFLDREEFFYLGESFPLLIAEDGNAPLVFDKGFRLMRKYLYFAEQLFVDWLRKKHI